MKRFEAAICGVLLLGLAVLIYGHTLPFPMVFDDEIYLVGNPIFKEFRNFSGFFSNFSEIAQMASKAGLDGDLSTNFLMRPLTYLSFYANHRQGGLDPAGYRLVNILIHCGNTLLVWRLSHLLIHGRCFASVTPSPSRKLIPYLGGCLFLVHPLQLESVVYIIQRATSLCTLFYLAAVICHLEDGRARHWVWRLGACAATLAAMLTKESGATAPIMAVGLDILLLGRPLLHALWRGRFLLCMLPVVPLMLSAVSHAQNGDLKGTALLTIAHGGRDISHALHYALTQPEVWMRYLGLFLWPAGLNIDPDVALVKGITDPRFWGASAVLLSLGLATALLCRLRPHSVLGPGLSLGLGWFAFTILPDSSLVPLPDCMAEHRSYLPYVGICFAAATLMCQIPRAPLAGGLGLLAAGALTAASVHRSRDWSSRERLWEDVARKSPNKARPWINLGVSLHEVGKFSEAETAFIRSIQASPTVPAFANLAALQMARNSPQEAFDTATKGLQFRPSGYDHFLLAQLGASALQLRKWAEASTAFDELLARFPQNLAVRIQLAASLLESGRQETALDVLRAGVPLHPDSTALQDAISTAERMQVRYKLRLGP